MYVVVYIATTNEEGTIVSRLIKRALAVIALCGVAACASAPHKTEEQKQADKVTAERVEAALSADRMLYARHITVHADNGVVWLSGYVWDRPDYDQATSVAQSVPGVTRVVNDLEFQRNGSDNNPISR
jgi:hyperosmotically inducible periplasmic protein